MPLSALSNLDTLLLSCPPYKRGNSGSASSSANGKPLHRILPSPLRTPVGLAIRAIGSEGRDSPDHLQRGGNTKMKQQAPKRREAQSAPIGLWDRFPTARTVQQMMETMERIMEDPFAYSSASLPSLGGEENGVSYSKGRTPWEIKEGDGEYKMRFDMPGMTKGDVKVWVEERMLVVNAKKLPKEGKGGEEGEEEEEEEWPPKSYGRYNIRIALPDNVEVEKIKAEVKDGVLYIAIPKVLSSSKILDIDVQ